MLFLAFSADALDILAPVAVAVGIAGVGVFVGLAIREARRQIRQNAANGALDENEAPEDSDDSWTPPEPIAFPARVVDMRAMAGNVGTHKRPKTDTSFLVTFLTDDGERVVYPVPEELYVTLHVDQTGTLVILNDGFFDFGDGEDMEEAPDETGI